MTVHCLFEQSGTFKNEFKKLGINAYDYDILNEFGQTDFKIDIFNEIDCCFYSQSSIFDNFEKDDLLIAFFPCIRFESQILLHFRGQAFGLKNWPDKKKMLNCMNLQSELTRLYNYINKLYIICIDKNLKLIVENPYSKEHYLTRYWCKEPTIIDIDRRKHGDYFKKPTQYWFLNIKPKNNNIDCDTNNSLKIKDPIRKMTKKECNIIGAKNVKTARSMIHPDYAMWFIKNFII